jgi:hypothetical protein
MTRLPRPLLALLLPALLAATACVGIDEPGSHAELGTVEQAAITSPIHLRVAWDGDRDEVVAEVTLEGVRARSATLLMGTSHRYGHGECFAGGRCTDLVGVRDQRVTLDFERGQERARIRFRPAEVRRTRGSVCFQAFTRDHQSRVECTVLPRTPPPPRGKDSGATESECALYADAPDACAEVPGCASGVFDTCFSAEARCDEHMTDRACFDADCVWHAGACTERSDTGCADNLNPTACTLSPLGCTWFINECITAPPGYTPECRSRGDDLWCELGDGCAWTGDDCLRTGCSDFSDSTSCESDLCIWVPGADLCLDPELVECSSARNQAACENLRYSLGGPEDRCAWTGDTCIQPPAYCGSMTNQLECEASPLACVWFRGVCYTDA